MTKELVLLRTEANNVNEMLANIFRGLLVMSRSFVHIVIDDRILSISTKLLFEVRSLFDTPKTHIVNKTTTVKA